MAKSKVTVGKGGVRGGGVGPRGGGGTTAKNNGNPATAQDAELSNIIHLMRANDWLRRHQVLKWCRPELKDAICANMGPDELLSGRCTGATIRPGWRVVLKDTPPYIVKPRTPLPCMRQSSLLEYGFSWVANY